MADIVEVTEVGAQVVEVVQVGPPGPAGPIGPTGPSGDGNEPHTHVIGDVDGLASLLALKSETGHTHTPAEIKSVYALTNETTPAEFYAAPSASIWIIGTSGIDTFAVLLEGTPLPGGSWRRIVNLGGIPARIATTSSPGRLSPAIPIGTTAELTYAGGSSVNASIQVLDHRNIAFTGQSTIPNATSTNPGLMSAAAVNQLAGLTNTSASWGPLILNRFRGLSFASSNYAPNGQNPSGMFSLGTPPGNVVESWGMDGSWPRIFNPEKMIGAGATYRIAAYVRVSGSFNDGIHCQIRVFDGITLSIVAGLGDFGGGSSASTDRILFATSSSLVATDRWMSFALYCGAYGNGNNSNGAVIQDVVLTFYRE
jgi:hypothetical protein